MKEIYNNGFIEYTKTDYINIISIMREAYNKSFEAESKTNQNNMVTNEAKININGTEVEVIELLDNFGLFVHSTDAYGNMNMINDNYYDSWNNNTNTANHGICSCYISNKSFGLPPIKDNGVLFGFTNINEESINLMAPYDLVTENDVYNIKSKRNPSSKATDTLAFAIVHTMVSSVAAEAGVFTCTPSLTPRKRTHPKPSLAVWAVSGVQLSAVTEYNPNGRAKGQSV